MSDSIANQLQQTPQFQPTAPTFPNRNNKKKNKIIAAVVLLFLLLVGGASSFVLLNQEQDTRNQASVAGGLVNVKLQKDAECVKGQVCSVKVVVNTGSSNIDALQLKLLFNENSLNAVDKVSFKPIGISSETTNRGSVCQPNPGVTITDKMLRYCSTDADCPSNMFCDSKQYAVAEGKIALEKSLLNLSKNETTTNKELLLVWTLADVNLPFNTNGADQVLGTVEFELLSNVSVAGDMSLLFDQSFSKATLYKTGQDSLNTPKSIVIATENTTVSRIPCKTDASCPEGQYCYQPPMPECPEGRMCPQVMASSYCQEKIGDIKPGACRTDADCAKNEFCYQTPQPSCAPGQPCKMIAAVSVCKEREITATPTPTRVPSPPVSVTPTSQNCSVNSDCPSGQYCYQPPMPACPEGMACAQVMPAKVCKESTPISMTPTRVPSPPATATPTPLVSVKPSVTPISCAIPDCPNGTLRLVKERIYDDRRYIMAPTTQCPVYICEESTVCQHDYSDWSKCNYGTQSRTLLATSGRMDCVETAPTLRRVCEQTCSSDSQCGKGESCVFNATVQVGQTTSSFAPSPVGYCKASVASATDLNGDGAVNVLDLSLVIKNLFSSNAKADVNKDGTVDIADYSLVLKDIISSYARIKANPVNLDGAVIQGGG
jgi:hypothetical protein